MAGTLDQFLTWFVPLLLILIVVGFVWIKTPVGSWLTPLFGKLWEWLKGTAQSGGGGHQEKNKVIVYD